MRMTTKLLASMTLTIAMGILSAEKAAAVDGWTNTASASAQALTGKNPATYVAMAVRDMHGSRASTMAPHNVMGLYNLCQATFPGTGRLAPAGAVVQTQSASRGYTTYNASQAWSCSSGPYTGWLNSFTVTYPNYALYRGDVATGKACLVEAAPAGGVVVQIKSIFARTAPPTSIVIPAGSLCGSFTFTGAGSSSGTEYLTVTVNGFSKYAIFDSYR